MSNAVIMTGKTIDDAIASALKALALTSDEVVVEVLEEATKGFLGIGTREAKVSVTPKNVSAKAAKDFLVQLFEQMKVDVKVVVQPAEKENELSIVLEGTDMGILIGRGGETLDALQYLTSMSINKGQETYVRVHLDTENYRKKREETLVRLANKVSERVQKYRRSITLEPMNPNERRIIHSTLHDSQVVSTYSTGDEPNRKVVVAMKNRQKTSRYNDNTGE
ncbi:MAG: protein jag [Hyphomonadaceae bacterium]|nr:protein jag [Clostridia bacterium]